ncbi:hypothetical protein PILCRDRAFT_825688, partial [Piloderma croceum F 1598]
MQHTDLQQPNMYASCCIIESTRLCIVATQLYTKYPPIMFGSPEHPRLRAPIKCAGQLSLV